MNATNDLDDLGHDFRITSILRRRDAAHGISASGRLHGHAFEQSCSPNTPGDATGS